MIKLGIDLQTPFAQFNLYTNSITFSGRYSDIYNVCWFAINSTYFEQIGYMQSALKLPEEYIPLDSFEGEGGFFYNRLTGEVLELEYMDHYLDPEPFDGVRDLLWDLHHAGVPLATATSKQTPMAIAQMEHLGLADAFDVIAGTTPDPGSSKTTVIHEAIARLGAMGADVSHPGHCWRLYLGRARRPRSRHPRHRCRLGVCDGGCLDDAELCARRSRIFARFSCPPGY